MATSQRWVDAIDAACSDPDLARSNRRITQLHYALSEALATALGREGGPNFHTWAVWGSRKAGATIRQEDLDSAIANATTTAGIVGLLVGAAAGTAINIRFRWFSKQRALALGACIGALTGGWTGRRIAIWSRARAANLVLEGNRIVLQEIGTQSAHFLEMIDEGATQEGRKVFFAGLRPGPTELAGQDRLISAFRSYLTAYDTKDAVTRRAAMIAGNCQIVYHEHIRLEPYIRGAMPWIVRRCTTQRLMTYEIGDTLLSVGQDIPGEVTPTAARNWADIQDRMRYVFALFEKFHDAPQVFSAPFAEK
jgi:hypothetical protein